MTSAPNWASVMPPSGAATKAEPSTTRRPFSIPSTIYLSTIVESVAPLLVSLDHTLVAQFINLTVVHTKQIFEHIYRVLSELGAQVPDLTRCFRQSGNHGRYNDRLSCFLFIHGDEIAAGVELTVAENVADIVQRPGWCSS